jgi:UPF0271 protein
MIAAVDLNADLGEGASADDALLGIITSANIACGGHAGDEETMRRTVRLANTHGVGVGAHPSYPDREGFGRRVVPMPLGRLVEVLAGQMRVLRDIAGSEGVRLQHVKAHGALYNLAVRDEAVAEAIGRAMLMVDASLIAVALAGAPMGDVFARLGLRVVREAFVDRGYMADGTLVPRDRPGALLTDPAQAGERAVRMVRSGRVVSVDGVEAHVEAQTLCLHADTPGSPAFAAATRRALEAAGIRLVAMRDLA